ncbi:MAG: hypothetical protein AAF423_07110 [Pseudomonadota bacterium]
MMFKKVIAALAISTIAVAAQAGELKVIGKDQDMSKGTVTAEKIVAGVNGWMVVHRIKENGKSGPVVGHAPLKKGKNNDVTAILTGPVAAGEKLMLMIHAEAGGNKTGIFEYSLGAKEDAPIKVDGNLVMAVVEAL